MHPVIHFNDHPTETSLLTIRNIPGEIVVSKQMQTGESVVDVSALTNGLYFVEIATPNKQTESRKLMIRK